eukprot:1149325-Pelagomonas_calceolata.AAC.1
MRASVPPLGCYATDMAAFVAGKASGGKRPRPLQLALLHVARAPCWHSSKARNRGGTCLKTAFIHHILILRLTAIQQARGQDEST